MMCELSQNNSKLNIVTLSNFMNHHQYALSEAFYRLTGGNYTFVACSPIPEERRRLGYHEYADIPFLLQLNDHNRDAVMQMIDSCDVLICGSVPDEMIAGRIRNRRLTFRTSERLFKTPFTAGNLLHRVGSTYKHFLRYQNEMQYSLCASAYTPLDMSRFGCYRNRMYRWGYFPEVIVYDIDELMCRKDPKKLLWCGRLLDWKRPDAALYTAKRLYNEGLDFTMDIIGVGPMERQLRDQITEWGLKDRVRMLGAMSPEEVRRNMCEAGVFLMTSSRREGWGAVVNEAMNSGCAVVGAHLVGAVPWLIRDGVNGRVYPSDNPDMLSDIVRDLLRAPEEQRRMGKAAYQTMAQLWNPEAAAERLIRLAECIIDGGSSPELFPDGPCSKAEVLHENWLKK